MQRENTERPLLDGHDLRQAAGCVCVAVAGPDMLQTAAAALADSRFLEFRLDSLSDPSLLIDRLQEFLDEHQDVVAVATCRRTAFGGSFTGTAALQVEILTAAARGGCRLVDIETETAEELGPPALSSLREAGAAVILSWHDFAATPDLEAELARMKCFAPDFCKIVPTAQTLRDGLRVIDLLQQHGGDGRLVAMSMGFRGTFTRVLGPRYGSAFTFAAAEGHAGTAPGQMSVRTLRGLYRVDSITEHTAVYAVTGLPISGSLSPLVHNTAFVVQAMDAVYLPLETDDPAELREVLERLDVRGVSVTMPLKETAMHLVQSADAAVNAIGACNTFRKHDKAWEGFNTDAGGVVTPLAQRLELAGARVLILGAGGAARAAVYGLVERGAQVYVLNRSHARAVQLAEEFGAHAVTAAEIAETSFDAVINSTPFGMRNQTMDAPIDLAKVSTRIFFDLVYNPVKTPLMQDAQHLGLTAIPGLEMFAEQAVLQFNLWTGEPAPAEEMQRALVDALQSQ